MKGNKRSRSFEGSEGSKGSNVRTRKIPKFVFVNGYDSKPILELTKPESITSQITSTVTPSTTPTYPPPSTSPTYPPPPTPIHTPPRTLIRTPSLSLLQTEIVTFSMPIFDKIFNCGTKRKGIDYLIYSGEITLEDPDECQCTPVPLSFLSCLVSDFVVDDRNVGSKIAEIYNSCYKQYYLFALIFKKLIACKNGRCESREGTRLYNFSQESYCCGYYAAVSSVAYRFFQLDDSFDTLLDMDGLTLDEFIRDLDSNPTVFSLFQKLCNLTLTYTSYFKNTHNNVTPRFRNRRTNYIETDNMIQLCTIYNAKYTFHHFCTLNVDVDGVKFVIMSDAWLDIGRRPLWTRFIPLGVLRTVITMINTSTGLSKKELSLIRRFFFQPKLSPNFPTNIAIDFIPVDFLLEDDPLIFKNPDGSVMRINKVTEMYGLVGGKL